MFTREVEPYELDIAPDLTQDEQVSRWLRLRTTDGLHTFELRGMFIANPSQRFAMCVAKWCLDIVKEDQRFHGGAMGTRFWLRKHAPSHLKDAPAVKAAVTKSSTTAPVGELLSEVDRPVAGRDTSAAAPIATASSSPGGSANTGERADVERPYESGVSPGRPSGDPSALSPSPRAVVGSPDDGGTSLPQPDLFGLPPVPAPTPYQDAA